MNEKKQTKAEKRLDMVLSGCSRAGDRSGISRNDMVQSKD